MRLLCFLLLGLLLCSNVQARTCAILFSKNEVLASIKNIHSTQDHLPMDHIENRVEISLDQSKKTPEDARKDLIVKRSSEGVYGPDGKIYIVDGNSHIYKQYILSGGDKNLKVPVKIIGDFRSLKNNQKGWKEFIDILIEKNWIFFDGLKSMTLSQIIKELKKDFIDLSNIPASSTARALFKKLGLSGTDFRPHIHMRLLQFAKKYKFKVKKIEDNPLSEASIEYLLSIIKKNPEIIDWLITEVSVHREPTRQDKVFEILTNL